MPANATTSQHIPEVLATQLENKRNKHCHYLTDEMIIHIEKSKIYAKLLKLIL